MAFDVDNDTLEVSHIMNMADACACPVKTVARRGVGLVLEQVGPFECTTKTGLKERRSFARWGLVRGVTAIHYPFL